MPAEQGSGGRTIALVLGAAAALGVVVGVLCVVNKGSGPPQAPIKAAHAHKDVLVRAPEEEGARSDHVNATTAAPTEPPRDHQEHHKRERRNETEVNATERKELDHKKAHHGHHHQQCSGGPAAACECMLKCEVFGGNVSHCGGHDHNATRELVDQLIQRTMLSHKTMCEGMRCIKECAKELDCLDEKVMKDCHVVQKSYEDAKFEADAPCDLQCDE
mmetsp:Transcript_125831/g.367730  ORF Transcript_125831/g.367730 Transcript_125831/m.367730 type:complete len:217 (+) Transcript_125831:74-724(+)